MFDCYFGQLSYLQHPRYLVTCKNERTSGMPHTKRFFSSLFVIAVTKNSNSKVYVMIVVKNVHVHLKVNLIIFSRLVWDSVINNKYYEYGIFIGQVNYGVNKKQFAF